MYLVGWNSFNVLGSLVFTENGVEHDSRYETPTRYGVWVTQQGTSPTGKCSTCLS